MLVWYMLWHGVCVYETDWAGCWHRSGWATLSLSSFIWNHKWNEPSCLYSQPQSMTALWPVLICHPVYGRRLSWPRCLGKYQGGLLIRRHSPISVGHGSWEWKLRPSSPKYNALTTKLYTGNVYCWQCRCCTNLPTRRHVRETWLLRTGTRSMRFLYFCSFLWSPYVIGQTIIFSSCFFLSSSCSFFPCLISAVGDWMFTIFWHMVWS